MVEETIWPLNHERHPARIYSFLHRGMSGAPAETISRRAIPFRAILARQRALRAQEMLAECRLCSHDCGVNRLGGETGFCRAGPETRFFSAQAEVSDEIELIPTFAVALSGCDLRCNFCITGASSWNPRAGSGFDPAAMAARAKAALRNGARTIMVLGGEPTIHLPAALQFVSHLPESAKLIWKTNAHATARTRELLEGMFDVWLADFKFGNDACAQRLAKAPDYVRVVQENLQWASTRGALIVRHLLMPGHVECCWRPVATWIAENLAGARVNLRAGFWPAWRARDHREFQKTLSPSENAVAFNLANELGLNLIV